MQEKLENIYIFRKIIEKNKSDGDNIGAIISRCDLVVWNVFLFLFF